MGILSKNEILPGSKKSPKALKGVSGFVSSMADKLKKGFEFLNTTKVSDVVQGVEQSMWNKINAVVNPKKAPTTVERKDTGEQINVIDDAAVYAAEARREEAEIARRALELELAAHTKNVEAWSEVLDQREIAQGQEAARWEAVSEQEAISREVAEEYAAAHPPIKKVELGEATTKTVGAMSVVASQGIAGKTSDHITAPEKDQTAKKMFLAPKLVSKVKTQEEPHFDEANSVRNQLSERGLADAVGIEYMKIINSVDQYEAAKLIKGFTTLDDISSSQELYALFVASMRLAAEYGLVKDLEIGENLVGIAFAIKDEIAPLGELKEEVANMWSYADYAGFEPAALQKMARIVIKDKMSSNSELEAAQA